MNKKILVFIGAITLTIAWGITNFSLAQEATIADSAEGSPSMDSSPSVATDTDSATIQDVENDENVDSKDLETTNPKLLPDSPWYFAKNWWNDTRLFFTFNPVKKAELRQKIVDQKLLEIKKLVEKGKTSDVLDKAQKSYEEQQEKLRQRIEKIKQKAKNNPEELGKFEDKFIRHQILHDKILEKLENQVPEKVSTKIRTARERHLKNFGEVMFRLNDKEDVSQKLENALDKIKGSEFKDFKNLEFLKNLQEKIQDPEKRAKLEQAEEKVAERLKNKIEKMPEEKQLRIKTYIKNISGDKIKHLEILQGVEQRIKNNKEIKGKLEQGRQALLEKISEHQDYESLPKNQNCPSWSAPAPGFCKDGRIIIKRDEKGCPSSPICVSSQKIQEIKQRVETKIQSNKEEKKYCTQIWNPVCGINEKTYSNACFAKLANIKIKHKGVCKNLQASCAKAGQRVNRNPILGSTNRVCCSGLIEKRVSRSYSICIKAPSKTPLQPNKPINSETNILQNGKNGQ